MKHWRNGARLGFLATWFLLAPATGRSAEPLWSFSARGGFIVPAQGNPSNDWFDVTPILFANVGRRFGAHLSLLAMTGYMRSPLVAPAIRFVHTQRGPGVGFQTVQEGTVVPLALGLRFSPMASSPELPRPYIEISPALYWLHYETYDGVRPAGGSFLGTTASDQVLAAGGLFSLVVPGRIASRLGFEIGFSYLLSETFEGERGRFPGLNHVSMMGGLSFGL